VRDTDQSPLAAHISLAAEAEPAKSSLLFDVSKNQFHDLFPHLVDRLTAFRLQLVSDLL
jgi:hypothetical protein